MHGRCLDETAFSEFRQKSIEHFNIPDSTGFTFLLSTCASGLDINLEAADIAILFDVRLLLYLYFTILNVSFAEQLESAFQVLVHCQIGVLFLGNFNPVKSVCISYLIVVSRPWSFHSSNFSRDALGSFILNGFIDGDIFTGMAL